MKALTNQTFDNPTFDDLAEIAAIPAPVKHHANSEPVKKSGVTPNRKKAKEQKADPRGFRWQVRVWLDANKPDQLSLGKWIHEQKRARKFAPILRNALALYRELMDGNTVLLYELFPDLKPQPTPPAPDNDDLKRRVEFLEQLVLSQRSPGASNGNVKMLTANGQRATAPTVDNEDTLVVTKDVNAGAKSALNFIASAFALQGLPSPIMKG